MKRYISIRCKSILTFQKLENKYTDILLFVKLGSDCKLQNQRALFSNQKKPNLSKEIIS